MSKKEPIKPNQTARIEKVNNGAVVSKALTPPIKPTPPVKKSK